MPTFLINFSLRKEELQRLNGSELGVEEKKLLKRFFIYCQQDTFSAVVASLESKQLTYNDLVALIKEKTEYLKTGSPSSLEAVIQHEALIIKKTNDASAD